MPLSDRLCLLGCVPQGHSVNVLTIDHVTPLHEACLGDHVACARALIDAGANVSHIFSPYDSLMLPDSAGQV